MRAGDRLGDEDEVGLLEQQMAALAAGDGDAAEVLTRLAEAVFPGGVGMGDSARILWPEPNRVRPGPTSALRRVGPPSPREQLEVKIRHSEARFRSLVEQLPAVVFYAALGDEENEVYVSPQIESLLGFSQQEWLTNPLLWYSQLHPDDHLDVIEAFTRGVQTGEPFRAQVRFFSRDGDVVWILGEARLIRDESGRPAYFQGVGFDITMTKLAGEAMAQAERAKVEAAQMRAEAFEAHNQTLIQLNRDLLVAKEAAEAAAHARTTFLTTMSHELRTPLNSVIVLAGLLADDQLTGPQQDMIRRMQLASGHLLELINDVLEFSRLRAGHVEIDLRTFDLIGWIGDTLDIVGPRAAQKGLELRVDVAGGIPRRLTADEGRLRQVLLNLLANSVKFTAQGYVEVRIGAVPRADGRWEFECAVRDTGIGIRPEDAATLFDEFRQADSGISREFGGTGLGLAICRRLCELLGGRIWVDDNDGPPDREGPGTPGPDTGTRGPDTTDPDQPGRDQQGAKVVFTWVAEADGSVLTPPEGSTWQPAAGHATAGPARSWSLADPHEATPRPRPSPAGRSGPDNLRILIAEDNLMNQQVALLLLAAMGHQADIVATGDEAIAAVRGGSYDVVLMDVAMPGTDGLSATRAIRGLGSAIAQPYIVALTAHAFPGDAETCIESGMDDYVAKPIERAQLARALDAGARRAAAAGAGAPGSDRVALAPPAPPDTVVWSGGVKPGGPAADGHGVEASFDPSLPMEILTQFGPEPFAQLVAIFRTEATRSVAVATAAVAGAQAEDAQAAAHRLKSSAANLGARGLFASCTELEALARAGSLAGAERLTAMMADQLADALERLEAMVAEAEPPG